MHKEYRKNMVTALSAALAFVMAIYIRDIVKEWIKWVLSVLEISDGTTLVTGHTTNNGTIHMKGGRIIPQGGFTNNGNVIWEPGLYNNIADFNLDGEVNLQDFADFAGTWLWQAGL